MASRYSCGAFTRGSVSAFCCLLDMRPTDKASALGSSIVPIFVSLPKFASLLRDETRRGDLMKEVFVELYDISDTSILHQDRFLFIFDGLDELGFHFNLFDDCRLQAWAPHSMFVITARLGFLSEASGVVTSEHRYTGGCRQVHSATHKLQCGQS